MASVDVDNLITELTATLFGSHLDACTHLKQQSPDMRHFRALATSTTTIRVRLSRIPAQCRHFTNSLPTRARSTTVNLKKYAEETRAKWGIRFPPALDTDELAKAWLEAGCTKKPVQYTGFVTRFMLDSMSSGNLARDIVDFRFQSSNRRRHRTSGELQSNATTSRLPPHTLILL